MKIREWWFGLAKREQHTLLIGGVAAGLFVFYFMIFSPLHSGVTTLKQVVRNDSQLLTWMQSTVPQLQQLKKSTNPTKKTLSNSLLVTVDNSLKSSSLANQDPKLTQTNTNEIKLTLQKVPFNQFIQWLVIFTQQYPVTIDEVTITHHETPGEVTVNLTIREVN